MLVRKRNKMVRTKKKNYNPFKMWGSYIGFLIFISPIFLLGNIAGGNALLSLEPDALGLYTFIFGLGVVGFLVGWGIHSLIRRNK